MGVSLNQSIHIRANSRVNAGQRTCTSRCDIDDESENTGPNNEAKVRSIDTPLHIRIAMKTRGKNRRPSTVGPLPIATLIPLRKLRPKEPSNAKFGYCEIDGIRSVRFL